MLESGLRRMPRLSAGSCDGGPLPGCRPAAPTQKEEKLGSPAQLHVSQRLSVASCDGDPVRGSRPLASPQKEEKEGTPGQQVSAQQRQQALTRTTERGASSTASASSAA